MAKAPHRFKRLVLGLQPGTHTRSVRHAVELASLLHLDLLGLFLEDTSLHDFAGLPFSRELRLLGDGWHAIDIERLSRDLELSARGIERKFTRAAKRLPTGFQFAITRAAVATAFASVSKTDDIVMIVEPQNPAERATRQFAWLLDAAFQSAGAIMLLPPRVARTSGPVVAICVSPDDPSVDAAAAIAAAAKERLVIMDAGGRDAGDARHQRLAGETGLSVERIAAGIGVTDPATGLSAGGELRERMVVMSRGTFADKAASAIAAARRVPVLVVEPSSPPDTTNRLTDPGAGS